MALFSFTQSGFEAYQNILNVADVTIGNAFSIDAAKNLIPNATGQGLGSTSLRFNTFSTNIDFNGTLTGSTGAWTIGTTHLTKDASGNFGIGAAASTSYKLNITGSNTTLYAASGGTTVAPTGATTAVISNTSNTNGAYSSLVFSATESLGAFCMAYIGVLSTSGSTTGILTIGQRTGAATYTERTRWDLSGHQLPGATNTYDLGNASFVYRKGYFGALSTTVNIGTTAIALDRASGAQSLTGISIDGSAATVTGAAQTAITSLGTLTGLTSSGVVNITNNTASTSTSTGALTVTGGLGVQGAVYGASFNGSGAGLTSLTGANVTGTVPLATSAVSVSGATQSAITSLGTLTGLTSSGAVSITNATASTSTSTGALIVTGGAGFGGAVYAASFNGSGAGLTSLTGANVTGTVPLATSAGTVSAAAQPSITSVGTLTGLTSSGVVNITNNTASTTTSTGALTVTGGIGTQGAINAASLTTSGTITATGGITNTFNLGTTALALNRASGAVALTGITSIDGSAASVGGKTIGTISQWGIGYADTATSIATTAAGTAAQLIQSNGTAAPTWVTFDMATHSPLFPHKMVKWATTVDIAPSSFAANVLTGYSTTNSPTVTTTLNSLAVTLSSTAGVKAGAVVSTATANIPANTVIATISTSTTGVLQDVPGWTVTTTAITGAAGTATATFAALSGPPYSVGSTIYVSGATPSTYNGTFTVTACTATTVSWASAETITATVQGSITNLITTSITGTGTTATATFAAKTYAPYAVGASVTITGATPSTYNGTFTLTACTTTSMSWASTETVTATVQGYVNEGITAGTAVSTTFTQTIAAFTPDGTVATVGDRVLVKDITTLGSVYGGTQYRGIYSVTTVGSTSVPWVLTRTTDADAITELAGAVVSVSTGTTNGGKNFYCINKTTDTLNTTAISFNKLISQTASSFISLPTTAVGFDIAVDTKPVVIAATSLADLVSSSFGRVTVSSNAATTYTRASTLYVAGTPIPSTNVSMPDAYSIYVAQGRSSFTSGSGGGALQAVGMSTSYGTLATPNTYTGALNVIMGTAANATWLVSGTSNSTFRGGIQLLDAGGAMRLYSNTTTGLAVVGSDLQPFATGTGNIGTTALRFVSVNANGADIAGNIKATGATSVIGYGTGSGGTVTQLTSKATGVTLSKSTGQITTAADALAANTSVAFTITNTLIASTADQVYVSRQSGGTAGAYNIWVDSVAVGSCVVYIRNITAGSLSEAIVLNFKVISGATA